MSKKFDLKIENNFIRPVYVSPFKVRILPEGFETVKATFSKSVKIRLDTGGESNNQFHPIFVNSPYDYKLVYDKKGDAAEWELTVRRAESSKNAPVDGEPVVLPEGDGDEGDGDVVNVKVGGDDDGG